jgi:hypothetical protein
MPCVRTAKNRPCPGAQDITLPVIELVLAATDQVDTISRGNTGIAPMFEALGQLPLAPDQLGVYLLRHAGLQSDRVEVYQ